MPSGSYIRSLVVRQAHSKRMKGRPSKLKGKPLAHSNPDCRCCFCKAKRGEFFRENNPMFGSHRTGKDNPNYKHGNNVRFKVGIGIENNHCKCGKEIGRLSKQCQKCYLTYNNPTLNSESRKKMGKGRYGKPPAYTKRYWFDVPNQGKVCLRSSWELIVAKYLVAKKADFRYEYKRFILDAKTFLPDFYLVTKNKFLEVKGWVTEDSLQKMREMKQFYPDVKIEMITKKEMKQIESGEYNGF